MSMYTDLLRAALEDLPTGSAPDDLDAFFAQVVQCRRELAEDVPPELQTADTVPVVLAREVSYDVSLIRLATLVGIETDPGRFEQPASERTRLEMSLRDRGLGLGPTPWPGPYRDR